MIVGEVMRGFCLLVIALAGSFVQAQTYPALWVKEDLESTVTDLGVSLDGNTLCLGGPYARALRCPQMTTRLKMVGPAATDVNSDGSLLAAYPIDAARNIGIVRVEDGAILSTLAGLGPQAIEIRFSPDGRFLGAVGDGVLRIWTLSNATLIRSNFIAGLTDFQWSLDGSSYFTVQGNDRIDKWDLGTGTILRTYGFPGKTIKHFDVTPDASRLLASDEFSMIAVNTVTAEQTLIVQEVHTDVAISDDGRTAYSNSFGVNAFDIASRQRLWNASVVTPKSIEYAGGKILGLNSEVFALDASSGTFVGTSVSFDYDWGYISRGERFCSTQSGVFDALDGRTLGTLGGTVGPDGTRLMTTGFWPAVHEVSTGNLLWIGQQRLDMGTSAWTRDGSVVVPGPGVETFPRETQFYSRSGLMIGKLSFKSLVRFTPDDRQYLVSSSGTSLVDFPGGLSRWHSPEGFSNIRFVTNTHRVVGRQDDSIVRLDSRTGALESRTPMEFEYSFVFGADGEVFAQDAGPSNARVIRFVRLSDGAILRDITPPINAFTIRAVGDEVGRLIWIVCTNGGAMLKNPYYMEGNASVATLEVQKGKLLSGGAGSLAQVDGDRMVIGSDGSGRVDLLFQGKVPPGEIGTVFARLVSRVSSKGLKATVELYDFSTGHFTETLERDLVPQEDVYLNNVPLNSTNFVGPNGELRARITVSLSQPGLRDWTVSLEQFAWQASP